MSAERPGPDNSGPDKPTLSPELKATEALLAALRPTAPAIDRDRVMYEAGVAAARQASWRAGLTLRRAATGVAVAASLLCGFWIGNRSARETLPQAARTDRPQPTLESSLEANTPRDGARPRQLPPDSYAELRRLIAVADVEFPQRAPNSEEVVPNAAPSRPGRADLLQLLN